MSINFKLIGYKSVGKADIEQERELGVLSTKIDALATTLIKIEEYSEKIEHKLDKHIQEEEIAKALQKDKMDRQRTITKWIWLVISGISIPALADLVSHILSENFHR